jgi:ferredoxin
MKAKLTFPALLAIAIALSTADSFAQATKPTAVDNTGKKPNILVMESCGCKTCHLAVFSGKLPSMEAELDDKLPYNSS